RGILRDRGHVAPGVEQLLSSQNTQKGHLHSALHAHLLFFSFHLRELHVSSENVSAQPEFSTRNDRLLHKKSLLPAADRSSSDFISRINHCRVRIQPGLLLACLGRANLRLRLPQCGIRITGDLLHLPQRNQRALHLFLRPSHPWIFWLYHGHLHRMVLLLPGHLHLLPSRDATRRQHSCNHHRSKFRSDSHVVSSSSLCTLCSPCLLRLMSFLFFTIYCAALLSFLLFPFV